LARGLIVLPLVLADGIVVGRLVALGVFGLIISPLVGLAFSPWFWKEVCSSPKPSLYLTAYQNMPNIPSR
jgi:hypothetical protein